MATRKARLKFTVRRFKNVMTQISKSKRGTLGVGVIVFFVILAILAPVIAPYDPIRPRRDPEQYPAFSGQTILKIADKLCYPVWYKYLPWITRGPSERIDQFVNTLVLSDGELYPKTTSFQLRDRVAEPLTVTAELPNGTVIELVQNKEWTWDIEKIRQVNIDPTLATNLPNGTVISVKYLTGFEITENIDILSDPGITSSETLNKINFLTNYSDSFNIEFNNEKGFKNDGCIAIEYSKTSSEDEEITLEIPFEYPHWSPPKSFVTHFSARLEADTSNARVIATVYIENKNTNKTYLISSIADNPIKPSPQFLHYSEVSTSNETTTNVGSLYPEQVIFPLPSNVSFIVKLKFQNVNRSATLYLDNLQCLLYGNSFGLLGTDNGSPYPPRDIFSTLVHGTRVSLIVGVLSALFSTIIGLFLGLISGYMGGFVDEIIMRFADLLLVLPTLPLFIVLIAVMKSTYGLVNIWNIIILITFFGWMSFSRSVRSMVLSIRERPFIEAAKAAGGGKFYIITRHIIPNVFPLVYVTLATSVPGAIITEASLSWLGLGDPSVPSWGKILYDFNVSGIAVTKGLTEYWFWIFPPCVAIALLATAFILLGFALDEILNPKLRERR
ncbi:hypothetical protein DRO69_06095 [Candidatus Bathyarchaeota archaeon]|nr:MAG: hypothetical protein DRO69_06095 [Candidatus Bathyarchaeota archaeon]